jgi:Uma2 family endonuclease
MESAQSRQLEEDGMVATKVFTADDLLTMPGDYELIRGELREVSPSSLEPTVITINVSSALFSHVRAHRLGLITSADGGFTLFPDRQSVVAPDLGFIRRERIPASFDRQHFFPGPPDAALEVVSPSDSYNEVSEKVQLYLEAGVRLIWVAIPKRRVVEVYRPGQARRILTENDELDGEDVIPGFRMPIREVFADPLAESGE